MPETNPYQTPKSSLNKELNIGLARGYRDGSYLVVRDGFEGPKICVVTGQAVESGAKPENVMLKSRKDGKWRFYVYGVILVSLAMGLYDLPYFDVLVSSGMWITLPIVVLVLIFVFKPVGGFMKIYCCSELRKKMRRLSFLRIGGILFALLIMQLARWQDWSMIWTMLPVISIILSNFIPDKKLLKSITSEGEYERFEGAHPHFLDALPTAAQLEERQKAREVHA